MREKYVKKRLTEYKRMAIFIEDGSFAAKLILFTKNMFLRGLQLPVDIFQAAGW